MKKNISLIIAGICIGIVGVYVVWFYQMSKTVAQNNIAITQVVDFLNKEIQANTPASAVTK